MSLAVATRHLARAFASEASFTASAYRVFDREVKRRQKDCAVSRDGGKRSRTVDYVRDEVADRMMERLLVMCLHTFPHKIVLYLSRMSKGSLIPSWILALGRVISLNCWNPTSPAEPS